MDMLFWIFAGVVGFFILNLIISVYQSKNPYARRSVTFKVKAQDADRSIVSEMGYSVADAFEHAFEMLEEKAKSSQRIETVDKYVSAMEEAASSMEKDYKRFDISSYHQRCHAQRKRLNEMIAKKGKYYSLSEASERARQRNLITNSLRYDVLKRDGFRCRLCGRSVAEGVVLHVDHIIPVSKGGKSTLDNLQTLCADCNLGKSNK